MFVQDLCIKLCCCVSALVALNLLTISSVFLDISVTAADSIQTSYDTSQCQNGSLCGEPPCRCEPWATNSHVNSTQPEVLDVVATPTRDAARNWVGVNISWSPGASTEEVKYDVILEERVSLSSDQYKLFQEETVEGNSSTWLLFPDLLAFWSYRVSVRATTVTNNGSWFGPVEVATLASFPGVVQNLTVLQDPVTAQKISVTFDLPREKDRNGSITQFVIRKTLLASPVSVQDQQDEFTVNASCSYLTCGCCGFSDSDVGGVSVEKNYTFAVRAINQDYMGNFSSETGIYIAARVPRLSLTGPVSLLAPTSVEGFVPEGTSVDVIVCSSCLTDSSQGSVTAVGLTVCVVSENSTCGCGGREALNLTTSDLLSVPSWFEARSRDFKIEYRATRKDWLTSLYNMSDTFVFTLGSYSGCGGEETADFCNGPLPTNKDITVSVFTCNMAGCGCLAVEGTFTTKSRNPPVFNIVGLGVGIGLGSSVILTCIVMGVGLYIKDRSRNSYDLEDLVDTAASPRTSRRPKNGEGETDSGSPGTSVGPDGASNPEFSDVGDGASSPGPSSSEVTIAESQSSSRTLDDHDKIEVISQEIIELPELVSKEKATNVSQRSRRDSLVTLM